MLGTAASLMSKPVAVQGSPGAESLAQAAESSFAAYPDTAVDAAQYDSIPDPLPPNVAGLGFHATGTSEFGDLVRLADHVHFIDSVTVVMSSWALRSNYPQLSSAGFNHPITLNLYAVDRTAGTPRPGRVLATVTRSFLIPWRPEPSASSSSPLRPWRAADGNYYPGRAFTISFDLSSLALALPDEVIFGIAFNTQHFGARPLGAAGPYNALHLGITEQLPSVGADLDPDAVFWRTAYGEEYADGGRAGVNLFRRDVRWNTRKPAVRFGNSPLGRLAVAAERLSLLPAPNAQIARALDDAQTLTTWALDRQLWQGNNRLRPGVGRLVFDVLLEAVTDLSTATRGSESLAEQTRSAMHTMLRVAEALAETSVGDVVLAGDVRRFARAQEAFDAALTHELRGQPARAMSEFGAAWREADASRP